MARDMGPELLDRRDRQESAATATSSSTKDVSVIHYLSRRLHMDTTQ